MWLAIVAIAGIGGILANQAELALLSTLAGLFAVAHAADLNPERSAVYTALAWVVPVGSVVAFGALFMVLFTADLPAAQRWAGLVSAGIGAAASLAAGFRAPARELARTLFGDGTSRVMRLAARLAVLATLFTVPAGLAFPIAAEQLARGGDSLVGGASSLWWNLVGLVLLALGGVGFGVRRDTRTTLERLGLMPLGLRQALMIAGGVAAMAVFNGAGEWLQRAWFPALWASDQRVNEMIAGSLGRAETLLLGLSAGLGEEITLRGALQPRLGIFRTSVLFALLHVQYSWFGIAMIAVLGLILGWIRRRSSTSVAIAVHALYDVVAVFTVNA